MITKFHPIALSKVWGGNKLARHFHLNDKNIGEIWGISAHKKHSNILLNGPYKGMTLRELYATNKELFGGLEKKEFPLLFKIIDAKENLSIQVHPDDDHAWRKDNSYGKDECWYILDTSKKETYIIIGHHAYSKSEILSYINGNKVWDIVNKIAINPGDFFYIPSGTLHAICKDTTLLEVSQSSDITYRIYDYERTDHQQTRALHIKEALDVIIIPGNEVRRKHDSRLFSFDIKHNDLEKSATSDVFGDYIYIIEGGGSIGNIQVEKNDFLMVSTKEIYNLKGNFTYALVNISH